MMGKCMGKDRELIGNVMGMNCWEVLGDFEGE